MNKYMQILTSKLIIRQEVIVNERIDDQAIQADIYKERFLQMDFKMKVKMWIDEKNNVLSLLF